MFYGNEMKKIFALLVFLVPSLLSAGVVYKYTDKQGNTVYTDQPRPGAQRVDLPEPSTYTPPKLPPRETPTAKRGSDSAGALYKQLTLTSPEPDATIWDNTGDLLVEYTLEPALRTKLGHRMVVSVDGEAVAPLNGTKVQLKNIDRGTHQLQAKVIDADGKVLIESQPAAVHLHRQSVNFPNRAKPSPR